MRHGATTVLAAAFIVAASLPGASLGGPAPLPDSRLGIQTAPLLLLSRSDVRADLGLDPRQADEAERAITELYARASAVKGMRGDAALAARREINQAMLRWLHSWLTEEQRKRLVQIDLQWEGPSSVITRPVVAEALELTPEQRGALKQVVDEHRRRRDQTGYQWSDEHRLAERVLAILTKPQRERWFGMLGRQFTPQLADAQAVPHRR